MARLAFLGSPEAAVSSLRALVEAGHDVVLAVTQPDRRRVRGSAVAPTPVKRAALDLGIAVSEDPRDVIGCGAELGVVVAYGRILRRPVLASLPLVNLHFSLLPRWRGAAPVERAILAGDLETGVCLMQIDEGLDTGPVYACVRLSIGEDETADELRERLARAGADLLVERLEDGPTSLGVATPQAGEPTYAAKIEPVELHLDWRRSAVDLARVVRIGKAWTTVGGNRLQVRRARASAGGGAPSQPGRLHGVKVATGDGWLELLEVQAEGRRPTSAKAWRSGARLEDGAELGSQEPGPEETGPEETGPEETGPSEPPPVPST